MKPITLVLLLVLPVILLVQADIKPHHYDVQNAQELFDQYVKDFEKVYKDDQDKQTHIEQFATNLQVLNDLNDKNFPQTSFGINQFTDLGEDELKAYKDLQAPEKLMSTGK